MTGAGYSDDPLRVDLRIPQGRAWSQDIGFTTGQRAWRTLQDVQREAPARLAVPSHGVPDGWRIYIEGAAGFVDLNRQPGWAATVIDSDTLELNTLNARNAPAYELGSGTLWYYQPGDLSGDWTGRAEIRDSLTSPQILAELTTDNGGLQIDAATSRVRLQLAGVQTAKLPGTECRSPLVYDAELTDPQGGVRILARGFVGVFTEVARGG